MTAVGATTNLGGTEVAGGDTVEDSLREEVPCLAREVVLVVGDPVERLHLLQVENEGFLHLLLRTPGLGGQFAGKLKDRRSVTAVGATLTRGGLLGIRLFCHSHSLLSAGGHSGAVVIEASGDAPGEGAVIGRPDAHTVEIRDFLIQSRGGHVGVVDDLPTVLEGNRDTHDFRNVIGNRAGGVGMTTTERLTTTTLAGSVLRLGLGVGLRDEDLLVLDITSNVGAGVQVEVVRLLRHTTTGAALTGGTTEVVRMVNLVHTRTLHEVVDTAVLINRVDAEEVVHHLLEVLDSAVGLVVHAVGLVVPVVQLLHTVKVQTLALRVLQEVLVELVRVTGSTTTTGAAATGLKVGVVGTILIGLDPVRLGVVGSVGGTISGLDRLSRRSLRDEHLLLLTLVVAPELLGVTTACLAVSSGHSVSLRSVDGGVVAVCVFDVEVDLLERSGLTGSGLSPAITADTAHVEILSLLLIPSVAKGLSFLYNRIIFVQVRFLELSRRVNEVPR